MKKQTRASIQVAALLAAAAVANVASAQPAPPAAAAPAPPSWTAQQDHQNMKEQLGIKALRPGPSGREGATNSANYDPAKANPFPVWPEILTLKNGGKVATAEQWWKERRPEIAEEFEREVYGRVPKTTPKVTWTISTQAMDRVVGEIPVHARQVVGEVDNAAFPAIEVKIQMTLVTPRDAKGPVPVLMMFGWGGMPRRPGEPAPVLPGRRPEGPDAPPPSTEQLIAAGWGYATVVPGSIQADNGSGLTKGIIGLVNQGQPRKPDDWGALRAWAWGAARGLDYLETDPSVDAKKVGIEGVSRYGKAALVTLAFEPRFALALVGSSGAGGAKPHRRNFGEAVENLTGSGQYHWMAGNFLKYGAAESSFGSKNAGDLPVDAHQLIALCAPRPTFISYGIPEKGDAHWLDQQGSFMAAVAAGEAFRLLGARDLGVKENYSASKMPPVNTGLLEGELAWRQHDGGHEDRSNMSHFIAWASRLLQHKLPARPKPSAPAPGPVGVYDSRAITVAYGGSPCMEEQMEKLQARMKAAKEAGAADEVARLESEGKAWQAALHQQAFNGAPVDNLLECLADALPRIQKEAGVSRIVSKWDKAELEKTPGIQTVDVTMALVDAFHPKPRQRQYAVDIQKAPLQAVGR